MGAIAKNLNGPKPGGKAHQPTALRQLHLRQFRNYETTAIPFESHVTVLFGANGAGKTNCLEAISLFSPGRGLRRASLEELDRDGQGPWRLEGRFDHQDGPLEITTKRDPETGRRATQLMDKPLKGPSALAELLSVTWLTPQMDRLFLEGASGRRRLLDRMVLTLQPDHATRSGQYERSLRERTAVLRNGGQDKAWLSALERRIVDAGVAIAAARLDLIDALNPVLRAPGLELPRIELSIEGEAESALCRGPALEAETLLADQLARSRERDRQAGGAGHGPHRSDLLVRDLETGEQASRTSTGRQKSMLLALILGEAQLRQQRLGDLPILLMDEVAAHLDASRRGQLCQTLLDLGAQVFLTGTDRGLFEPLNRHAQFLCVERAQIMPVR